MSRRASVETRLLETEGDLGGGDDPDHRWSATIRSAGRTSFGYGPTEDAAIADARKTHLKGFR